jgi:hypothetical protein
LEVRQKLPRLVVICQEGHTMTPPDLSTLSAELADESVGLCGLRVFSKTFFSSASCSIRHPREERESPEFTATLGVAAR